MHISMLLAEAMRLADQDAAPKGIPTLKLMDRAGELTAQVAQRMMAGHSLGKAIAICGPGNNGGDGLAACLHLRRNGANALAILLRPGDTFQGDSAAVLARAREEGVNIAFKDGPSSLRELLKAQEEPFLLIDALFGTGFKPPAREPFAAILETLAKISAARHVLSIDLPSGVDADTGALRGPAVHALKTLTLGALKPALFIHPAAGHAGKVILGDIGHPRGALSRHEGGIALLESGWARYRLDSRPRDSHKGMYGHLLVIAGSRNMPGAAHLAVRGGLRGGAGLVTLGAPAPVCRNLAVSLPEALWAPLPHEEGILVPAEGVYSRITEGKDVLVFGPGITTEDGIHDLVWDVLNDVDIPIVLDADSLNALGTGSVLAILDKVSIVTPHPGELSRLMGIPVDEIQADRLHAAKAFAEEHKVITVLKGAGTLVASPDGDVLINSTGNPGMASGGMGDVLAGLIGSLLAQGHDPLDAAGLGVYLHGLAGDLAAKEVGPWGFTASEVADRIPKAVAAVLKGHEDVERI